MKYIPVWQRWWFQALVAVGVATLVPIVTHKLGWTTTVPQGVIVGIAVWNVGMIFQIAHSLHSFHVERLEVKHSLQVVNEHDSRLLELQTKFREIVSRKLDGRPNHVFLDYLQRNLEGTLNMARRAAQRGELEVHDHHFDTIDTVLAAFDGCRDRTYRCVWLIEDGEHLFDKYWKQYMKSLVELSRKSPANQRVRVRILFVADDEIQLGRRSVRTLLGFVSAETGFEYRVISAEEYKSRLRDGRLDIDCIDFGIYGDHLLFRTISYDPHVGVFSDEGTAINSYRAVHEAAMDAAQALNVEETLPANVSLDQFLNCDALAGRER